MSAQPDLTTTYLGLELSGPVIASSSPLTRQVDTMLELEAAGAAAVVLPSLFQEEAEAEEMQAYELMELGDGFAEFGSAPLSSVDLDSVGPGRHVKLLRDAKQALSIPVIASLNATNAGGWVHYAADLEAAGADALELNLYSVNADQHEDAAAVEIRLLDAVAAVCQTVQIPVAVKMSRAFTSVPNVASRFKDVGARGLVLFSGLLGTDVDVDELTMVPRVTLTTSSQLLLPMRWIGILDAQVPDLSYAATSGVHNWQDVAKTLLVGADVACTTSAVLKGGPQAITAMLDGLREWMIEKEYDSVAQLRGSMNFSSVPDPGAYERDMYMKVVTSTPVIR